MALDSVERTTELLDLLTNGLASPSPASICNAEAAERNSERCEELKQDTLNAEVLHTDETPVRSTERLEYDKSGENPHLETAQELQRVHPSLQRAQDRAVHRQRA